MRRGFTIIELLMVVVITAIISAFAIPSYRAYALKTRVASALSMSKRLSDKMVLEFEKNGSWPTSMILDGNTIGSSWSSYVSGDIVGFKFYSYQNRLVIHVNIANLSGVHANYQDPTGAIGDPNYYSEMAIAIVPTTNSYDYYCGGHLPTHTGDIPSKYWPKVCTCTSINSIYASGDTSSCS